MAGEDNGSALADFRQLSTDQLYKEIHEKYGKVAADILKEADIDGATLQELKREDLLELFPSVEHFKLRKLLLKLIEENNTTSSLPNKFCNEITNTRVLTPSQKKTPNIQDVGSPLVSCTQLQFPVYTEPGVKEINSSDIRNRIIRNTINSMRSITFSTEKREPYIAELESMAKAIVEHYPTMKDCSVLNPNNSHEGVLLLLKRRLANVKPVKKRQGPCPTRGKKRLKFTEPIPNQTTVTVGEEEEEVEENSHGCETTATSSLVVNQEEEEMSQHYSKLQEKFKEKKPNNIVISQLLDLELKSRRNFIESLSSLKPSGRVDAILKAYPCFTTAVHVLEEMQRILKETPPFLPSCIEKLSNLWDKLFLYSICQKIITVSGFMDSDDKAKSVLVNFSLIIPGGKKNVPLAVEIDEDDLQKEVKKSTATIFITSSGLFVCMYGRIFSKLEKKSYNRAILIFIALFYTFHLEYLPGQENIMLFLQTEILCDQIHHKDQAKFNKIIKNFKDFIKE